MSASDVASAALWDSVQLVPGQGRCAVSLHGAGSVVARIGASSPLRLLTPRNQGHGAWIYTSTFGGGIVDGDVIDLDVEVTDGATAYLSTQSTTKVYRSVRGSCSRLRAQLRPSACLVYAPDPVVCFARARYRQEQAFDLDDRATLVAVDSVVSGRYARGERWAFASYINRTTIRSGGTVIVRDALALGESDGDLASRLGRFDAISTVFLIGPLVSAEVGRLLAASRDAGVVGRADLLITASPVDDRGCLVRIAGVSVERVKQAIRDVLDFVPRLLGDDPFSPNHQSPVTNSITNPQ